MQPRAIPCERLHLRPLANADVGPIYQACQDPQIQQWTVAIPVPYRPSDAEWFVHENCPAAWAEDREYTWGIEEPATDEFLGVISLRRQEPERGEVGYWLAPAARSRGAMTRALAAGDRGQRGVAAGGGTRRVRGQHAGTRAAGPARRMGGRVNGHPAARRRAHPPAAPAQRRRRHAPAAPGWRPGVPARPGGRRGPDLDGRAPPFSR